MGNTGVNKVLPAVDMLLVLVVVLFATAGLLHSVPPGRADHKAYEALLAEQDRLNREIKSKKVEAGKLEGDLQELKGQDAPSSDDLETLLHATSGKQERIAEAQLVVADIRDKLNGVKEVLQEKHRAVTLESEIKRLKKEIERLEREKKEIEKRVTEADREKALVQALHDKLEELKKEIERLKNRLAELEKEVKEKDGGPLWGGKHHDPYILLECDKEGVVVYYPDNRGNKRILLNAPEREIDRLRQEIKQVGAVALVARPSSFKESYDKFYEIVTKLALKEEERGNEVLLSLWPICEQEQISPYVYKYVYKGGTK